MPILQATEVAAISLADQEMRTKPDTVTSPRYLGANNIAGMKWCHQKFLFRAHANEDMFRRAYEEDCKRLGQGLTVQQLNSPLKQVHRAVVSLSDGRVAVVSKGAGKLSHREIEGIRHSFEDSLRDEPGTAGLLWADNNVRIELLSGPGTTPQGQRGLLAQYEHGEQLPSLRYHFPFREYIIEASPDGIAGDYCYEFKLVGERFWLKFEKPVAVAQARLYSYFFERKRYKAEIYIEDEAQKETVEGELDRKWVEYLLNTMDALLKGSMEPIPPNRVKCRSCEFSKECPIRQT